MPFPLVPFAPQGLLSGGSAAVSIAAAVDELKLATASIAGLDPVSNQFVTGLEERAFQFWPSTIEDSIEIGWAPKEIPGASHSLMQWTSNGGRTITFDLPLRRYMDYNQKGILIARSNPANVFNRPFNENIDYAIKYFRAFCYPIQTAGEVSVQAPPIAIINFPGMALNENGGDHLFTVMTTCDITYEHGFPETGHTKSAKLSLAFKQVVQGAEGQFAFRSIGSGSENYMALNASGLGRTSTGMGNPNTFDTLHSQSAPGNIIGKPSP